VDGRNDDQGRFLHALALDYPRGPIDFVANDDIILTHRTKPFNGPVIPEAMPSQTVIKFFRQPVEKKDIDIALKGKACMWPTFLQQ
jgi:hypothetical protein